MIIIRCIQRGFYIYKIRVVFNERKKMRYFGNEIYDSKNKDFKVEW